MRCAHDALLTAQEFELLKAVQEVNRFLDDGSVSVLTASLSASVRVAMHGLIFQNAEIQFSNQPGGSDHRVVFFKQQPVAITSVREA